MALPMRNLDGNTLCSPPQTKDPHGAPSTSASWNKAKTASRPTKSSTGRAIMHRRLSELWGLPSHALSGARPVEGPNGSVGADQAPCGSEVLCVEVRLPHPDFKIAGISEPAFQEGPTFNIQDQSVFVPGAPLQVRQTNTAAHSLATPRVVPPRLAQRIAR